MSEDKGSYPDTTQIVITRQELDAAEQFISENHTLDPSEWIADLCRDDVGLWAACAKPWFDEPSGYWSDLPQMVKTENEWEYIFLTLRQAAYDKYPEAEWLS